MASDDNNNTTKDELKRQVEGIVAELQTLRDEIRVRIHLGGMDLKDTWNDIESRLEGVEQQIPEVTQKVRDAATELRDRFRALRDKLG